MAIFFNNLPVCVLGELNWGLDNTYKYQNGRMYESKITSGANKAKQFCIDLSFEPKVKPRFGLCVMLLVASLIFVKSILVLNDQFVAKQWQRISKMELFLGPPEPICSTVIMHKRNNFSLSCINLASKRIYCTPQRMPETKNFQKFQNVLFLC